MGKFEITGTKKMARKIADIEKQFLPNLANAMLIEAEGISTKSKRDHVPVDLGALRSSIHVTKPIIKRTKPRRVTVAIRAGGAAAPYALAVHNHPGSSDPPSWRGKIVKFNPSGRGPQYLGIPLRNAVRGMAKRIAGRIGF